MTLNYPIQKVTVKSRRLGLKLHDEPERQDSEPNEQPVRELDMTNGEPKDLLEHFKDLARQGEDVDVFDEDTDYEDDAIQNVCNEGQRMRRLPTTPSVCPQTTRKETRTF